MAKKTLTLDVGASTVALAEYEVGAKGALKLLRYGTAPLATPLDETNAATVLPAALSQITREKGIRPGPVAVSVSGQMVFPKFAAITPVGGEEKFEQLIRFEIEQNIPFPIDEMVCDRQVLGDAENGDRNVMIVAAKVDQVEAITGALQGCGFSPELVDVAPIAFTNAVKATRGDDDTCVVMLDIGAKTTSLVISEGDRFYTRSIPIAGNNVNRDIAAALGCSPDEAEQVKVEKGYVSLGGVAEDEDEVADRVSKVCRTVLSRLHAEISRSINFYRSQQGGGAPVKLYLTGGTTLLPQLDAFFAESLQIEVEYFNPFELVTPGAGVDADALEHDGVFLAPTLGLALHSAGAARFAVNLLPPSLVRARAERAKVPFVAAAGVTLVAGLALAWLAIGHQGETARAMSERVDGKVNALKTQERKLKDAEAKVETAKAGADALCDLMSARYHALVRLNAVRSALAPGMWIEKWSEGRVTVRGWEDRLAEAVASAAERNGGKRQTPGEIVVEKLKTSTYVDPASVRIADMSSLGKSGAVKQFTVELKFK